MTEFFQSLGMNYEWAWGVATISGILLIALPLMLAVAMIIYVDRKVWAAINLRRGPNVVGPFGLLQSFADGLKVFLQETIIPSAANKGIFLLAPIITFTVALLAWAVIPTAVPIPASSATVSPVGSLSLTAEISNSSASPTAIVNVRGNSSIFMQTGSFTLTGTNAYRVLYNFGTDTEVTIKNVGVKGSLLAPSAAVTFDNGHIDGTLVAASLSGTGESHEYLFDGTICLTE